MAFAAVSLVSLTACAGGSATGGLTLPAARAVVPLTRTVDVTALDGGKPVSGLQITLTRNSWPGGKLIAKGKTGLKGHVKLSGNWTNQELICAGGTLHIQGGIKQVHKCEAPFPAALTLRF